MIAPILMASAVAQSPPIVMKPFVPAGPTSKPRFDVECELRDLAFANPRRVTLTQNGGRYIPADDRQIGGRMPIYIRFHHDDLGISNGKELNQTGSRMTDWYADGPIEMVGQNGSLTLYKTTPVQAWRKSPTTIAVTGKAGRLVRRPEGGVSLEEVLLVGSCEVSWAAQAPAGAMKKDGGSQ